jgi:F-type H+-transporting ATPase subunit b
MQIDLGAELVNSGIILVTFLLLMAVLDAVVFRPVLRLLDEREARTHGAVDEAKALEAEAASALAEYERRVGDARDQAAAETAAARKRAADDERRVLDLARADAAARVEQIEREVAAAATQARAGLAGQARDLARSIAEKLLGRPVGVGMLLAAAALVPTEALAAESAHGNPIRAFVFHLVNFAILVFLLVKFAGPKVSNMLRERRAAIEKAIGEAAAVKTDAEARLRQYRERLARADAEIEGLRSQYRADAEAERARILAEAEEAAKRIRRAAEQAAAQETAKARVALREEAARLATDLAEQTLRREVTPADQGRLVQEFVTRLPGAAGNGQRQTTPDDRGRG